MNVEGAQPSPLARASEFDADEAPLSLARAGVPRKSQNMTVRNLRRFLIGNRLNLFGLLLVMLFLFLSVFGAVIAPYDPTAKGDIINAKLVGPSSDHILGTDEQGRDVFSRVLAGARDSLLVAAIV